jgi:ubiquinol-cytochrome c reductase cytochrome b subunit
MMHPFATEGPLVFTKFLDWLDHRTGCRRFFQVLLIEHIPGGAKWRYVWGSCLAFVFTVQLITGLLLMTAYSPGESTAWSSVFFIQYKMDFGWFVRGLHHFGSQTMVVLLAIHMLQVVIAGAHLPPREVNWWLGLLLMGVVLALSLTGYLLPWDQKGYYATQVATNIAGNLPEAGPFLQKTIVGGPEYGHHTLSRFYTMHVGILPALMIILIILHLVVFRRHGVTTRLGAKGEGWFWPDQAFKDMVVSMIIFGVMIGLVVWGGALAAPEKTAEPSIYERLAHLGRTGSGANLDAPADPSTAEYPARPEWYFLFLFQLLKYFPGDQELLGTVIIPQGVVLLLFMLPLLGYGRMRKFGHVFGVVVVGAIFAAATALTCLAVADDLNNSKFQEDRQKADEAAKRAVVLADQGIPEQGAKYLLRNDPWIHGPVLFEKHCAACHTHEGIAPKKGFRPTAPDLTDFGTKKWLVEFLHNPNGPQFLGRVKDNDGKPKFTKMDDWVKRQYKRVGSKGKADLEKSLEQVATWLGSHPRGREWDNSPLAKGFQAFKDLNCTECHRYSPKRDKDFETPDLTGYGSAEWLRLMIMAPGHPRRYGDTNQMPVFRPIEGAGGEMVKQEYAAAVGKLRDQDMASIKFINLNDIDRELIIRWLLRDYRVVFGGSPLSGPARTHP